MEANKTATASRIYFTTEHRGIWRAHFQPINPKTGKPWQASRMIRVAHDCYRLSDLKNSESTGVIMGKLPPFEVWTSVGRGMTSSFTGHSTEALALAAIAAEKERSGK